MSAPVLSGHQGAAGADPAGPVVKPHPERIARELATLTCGGVSHMRRMTEWPFNPTPQPIQSFIYLLGANQKEHKLTDGVKRNRRSRQSLRG